MKATATLTRMSHPDGDWFKCSCGREFLALAPATEHLGQHRLAEKADEEAVHAETALLRSELTRAIELAREEGYIKGMEDTIDSLRELKAGLHSEGEWAKAYGVAIENLERIAKLVRA